MTFSQLLYFAVFGSSLFLQKHIICLIKVYVYFDFHYFSEIKFLSNIPGFLKFIFPLWIFIVTVKQIKKANHFSKAYFSTQIMMKQTHV